MKKILFITILMFLITTISVSAWNCEQNTVSDVTMNQSVTCSNRVDFNSDNIVFDCAGYTINDVQFNAGGGQDNITIKNCMINNTAATFIGAKDNAIIFNAVNGDINDIKVYDTTIHSYAIQDAVGIISIGLNFNNGHGYSTSDIHIRNVSIYNANHAHLNIVVHENVGMEINNVLIEDSTFYDTRDWHTHNQTYGKSLITVQARNNSADNIIIRNSDFTISAPGGQAVRLMSIDDGSLSNLVFDNNNFYLDQPNNRAWNGSVEWSGEALAYGDWDQNNNVVNLSFTNNYVNCYDSIECFGVKTDSVYGTVNMYDNFLFENNSYHNGTWAVVLGSGSTNAVIRNGIVDGFVRGYDINTIGLSVENLDINTAERSINMRWTENAELNNIDVNNGIVIRDTNNLLLNNSNCIDGNVSSIGIWDTSNAILDNVYSNCVDSWGDLFWVYGSGDNNTFLDSEFEGTGNYYISSGFSNTEFTNNIFGDEFTDSGSNTIWNSNTFNNNLILQADRTLGSGATLNFNNGGIIIDAIGLTLNGNGATINDDNVGILFDINETMDDITINNLNIQNAEYGIIARHPSDNLKIDNVNFASIGKRALTAYIGDTGTFTNINIDGYFSEKGLFITSALNVLVENITIVGTGFTTWTELSIDIRDGFNSTIRNIESTDGAYTYILNNENLLIDNMNLHGDGGLAMYGGSQTINNSFFNATDGYDIVALGFESHPNTDTISFYNTEFGNAGHFSMYGKGNESITIDNSNFIGTDLEFEQINNLVSFSGNTMNDVSWRFGQNSLYPSGFIHTNFDLLPNTYSIARGLTIADSGITINGNNAIIDNLNVANTDVNIYGLTITTITDNLYSTNWCDYDTYTGNIITSYTGVNMYGCPSITELNANTSTDWENVANWSNVNVILDNSEANVQYDSGIDFTGTTASLDDKIRLEHNSIEIESTEYTFLDAPATIIFKNVDPTVEGRTNFVLNRNGVECTSIYCTSQSYNETTQEYTVIVTGFSTYDLEYDEILLGNALTGMAVMGSDLGGFLSNLAPGVGSFILIMGIFGGIVAIFVGIPAIIKKSVDKKYK